MRRPALALPCALVPALVLAPGCRRDPFLVGLWEITGLRVQTPDGEDRAAQDVGSLEISGDGTTWVIFRYGVAESPEKGWTLAPLAQPPVLEVASDVRNNEGLEEFGESFQDKGETFTVRFDAWSALPEEEFAQNTFRIEDWDVGSCTLVGAEVAPWPSATRMPVALDLVR